MDIVESMKADGSAIQTISMHTVGEPTRIIVRGYPDLQGDTLLQKRDYARSKCDDIRKLLMHEPRGHQDMYGAILVQETEFTITGEADIGVLFCHNEGYSTMCGHATIALGRFLVDTQDHVLFPNRNKLKVDQENREVHLRLHAPCGIVRVTVPVKFNDSRSDALGALGKSAVEYDQSRLVSFLSVPSFSVLTNLELEIPVLYQWPELIQRTDENLINESFIKLDIAFGGAFYAIARASELGFRGKGMRVEYSRDAMKALDLATSRVKSLLKKKMPEILSPYSDAVEKDLQFLYGISVVDDALDKKDQDYEVRSWKGKDRNLCFFADQQLDRSPTGSCVSARVALAATNGALKVGETWEYHSIVSEIAESEPFLGTAVERVCIPFQKTNATASPKFEAFVVKVEGRAWYVGAETHVHEGGDTIGKGFRIDTL